MGAVDWTEKCRDEFPDSAGYLDYPIDGIDDGQSLSALIPYLNESTRDDIDDQEDDDSEENS